MRLRPVNQVCIVALILIAAMITHQAIQAYVPTHPNPNPPNPPETKAFALFVYDVNSPPKLVDSKELREWMDQHAVAYRFASPAAKFEDDQPDFKKLMDQPRQADNWLYVHGGLLRKDDSVPMPADEPAAEKIMGKHAR